jgi:hypothetical protein
MDESTCCCCDTLDYGSESSFSDESVYFDDWGAFVQPSFDEGTSVEQVTVESVLTEQVLVEPVLEPANVAVIGGFDPTGGIAVVEPTFTEPTPVEPALQPANVAVIGGFDPNAGITAVEPTPIEPTPIEPTPIDVGTAPNVAVIGGNYDLPDIHTGNLDDFGLILDAGHNVANMAPDPATQALINHIGVQAQDRADIANDNAVNEMTNWGQPSNGFSYDYEHRLQNNSSGTSY